MSVEVTVPPALVATRRAWYRVPRTSLVMSAATFSSTVPDPALVFLVSLPYAVVVPYSKYQDVAPPFGLTLPFAVAPVRLMLVAGWIVTDGSVCAVLNVSVVPRVVPELFVATTLNSYVVTALRPLTAAFTDWAVVPLPASCAPVSVQVVVPCWRYSKDTDVLRPLGVTLPLRVAVRSVMALAALVVAD